MPAKPPPQIAPPTWVKADVAAFHALQRGDASPHLQQRALNWLLNEACGLRDLSFHPDNDRLTAFAEGRRFVGLQVAKMLSINPSTLKDE